MSRTVHQARRDCRARHGALFLAAALAVLVSSTRAEAHELPTATARVTLRDDHVSVTADMDVLAYVVQTSGAGTAASLAGTDEAELAELVRRARSSLETEARLEADGERVDLEIRAFPSVVEIRAVAEWFVAAPHAHGELRPVQLEGKRSVPGARRIALSLPPAVGPVLVTFVQPRARWTTPGGTAAFSVLGLPAPGPPGQGTSPAGEPEQPTSARLPTSDSAPPQPTSAGQSGSSDSRSKLAWAAVLLSLGSVLGNLALRRRAPSRRSVPP